MVCERVRTWCVLCVISTILRQCLRAIVRRRHSQLGARRLEHPVAVDWENPVVLMHVVMKCVCVCYVLELQCMGRLDPQWTLVLTYIGGLQPSPIIMEDLHMTGLQGLRAIVRRQQCYLGR